MSSVLSEDSGDPIPDIIPTIYSRYRKNVDENSDHLALIAVHQPAGLYGIANIALEDDVYKSKPYLRWNYEGFGLAVDTLARGLISYGARKGMALVTFVPNAAEPLMAALAASKNGYPFSPISPRNLSNIEETIHMINVIKSNAKSDRAILIVQDESMIPKINSLPGAQQDIKILIHGSVPSDDWVKFEDIMRHQLSPLSNGVNGVNGVNGHTEPEPEHIPNDEVVFFTSGTTSLPKGCPSSHPKWASAIMAKAYLPTYRLGDKWAGVMPNNHSYAYACTMMALGEGTCIVFPGPIFDPQTMFTVLEREQCSYVSLVPTMVHALCSIQAATGATLPNLKGISLGGAVLSPSLLHRCKEELGAETVENAYGRL